LDTAAGCFVAAASAGAAGVPADPSGSRGTSRPPCGFAGLAGSGGGAGSCSAGGARGAGCSSESSGSGRAGFSSLMPALCQPPYSQQPDRRPPAPTKAKRAKVDSPRCVDSKLALFAEAPEAPAVKILFACQLPYKFKKNNTNIARCVSPYRILRCAAGRNLMRAN
jgi:hypothetical protein